jgi:voltage-gated potassium channel
MSTTPSKPHDDHAGENLSPFQLLLALLTLAVMVTLGWESVGSPSPEVAKLIHLLDTAACALFFLDFCHRLWRAPDRRKFMQWGWIDLVACVPNVDWLRLGRLGTVLRLIRVLRGVRIAHRLSFAVLRMRRTHAFGSVMLTTAFVVAASSLAVLSAEHQHPNANIKTAGDAVWWSMTTITTVGYGDKYPVTRAGRTVAITLMLAGVGLFGTLSGITATFFLGSRREAHTARLLEKMEAIERRLDAMQPPQAAEKSKARSPDYE